MNLRLRPSALEGIVLGKPHVVRDLCEQLHLENNPSRKADIIRALGYSQDEFAIRHVLPYLDFRNKKFGIPANREVQVEAAFALVKLGDPVIVDRVAKRIEETSSRKTKWELANALWHFVGLAKLNERLSNRMEGEVKKAEALAKKYH
ncbi:MAG: hypothetical protein V1811_01045 [Candidatus Micrarchaeota archaeon]